MQIEIGNTNKITITKDRYFPLISGYAFVDILDGLLMRETESEDVVIKLTKKELKLIKTLAINNFVVDTNYLIKELFNNKKSGVFSLRNLVKSIRDKTDKFIILNKNGVGYTVNRSEI